MPWAKEVRVPPGPDGPADFLPSDRAFRMVAMSARVSEPCSASMAAMRGKVAARDNCRESPAKTPVTMESTRISAASRPMRRLAKSNTDSSPPGWRRPKNSAIVRRRPGSDSMGDVRNAGGDRGTGTRRPWRAMKRSDAASVAGSNASASPAQ
jgi:hypothetical protein